MHSSDEEGSRSASEDSPIYEQAHLTNKYLSQSGPTDNHSKDQNIIHKKGKPIRNNLQSHTFGLITEPQFRNNDPQNDRQLMASTEPQAQRLRLLLEREIEKNRELERQLFVRQKELISLRTRGRDRPLKKSPIVNRVASPAPHLKTQQIRQIQQELERLKLQVTKNSIRKEKFQELKSENSKLKKTSQRHKQFVDAVSVSLGMMMKSSPPRGLKQTWKTWREVLNEVGADSGVNEPS